MNRSCLQWTKAGCLAGALLLLASAGVDKATASPTVDEDYTRQQIPGGGQILREVNGRRGFVLDGKKILDERGAEYRGARFSSTAGAIQVLVAPSSLQQNDFLFEIDGAFKVYLDWARPVPGVAIEDISGNHGKATGNESVWGEVLPFPAAVPVGEWIVVTLTWGSKEDANQVYINGTALVPSDPEKKRGNSPVFSGADRLVLGSSDKFFVKMPDIWANDHTQTTLIGGIKISRFALSAAEVEASATAWLAKGAPLAIASVRNDAAKAAGFSDKLVADDVMAVTMEGTAGVTGTFDLVHYPDSDRKISLDWRGWGVYLEEKTFYEDGDVNLREVEGYRVYAGTVPFDPLAAGFEPVQVLKVEQQSCLLENLEIDTPYYVAVVAEMRDGTLRSVLAPIVGQPLAETSPGVYSGSWKVGYQDRYQRAAVVGRLTAGERTSSLVDTVAFVVDPALSLTVTTDPSEIKSDEKSESRVTVTVTDANGNPVVGHEIRYLLATTSRYTGVVGGGDFKKQVGGGITEEKFQKTDLFGRVSATYVAGFAAKTAVIVARDMESNSTGAGYVKTFIQASASLELLPVQARGEMDDGYEMTVTSSDDWLTADGKSRARITARITRHGAPVEGHRVSFDVAGGGSIHVVQETTTRSGEARAIYTAGKKIGIALITATDTTAGVSGSVSIELRSDAPAKIAIKLKDGTLPADGSSRTDLQVVVSDINDNPNDNTEVEYALTAGSGRLSENKGLTDRGGESSTVYTAGRTPGTVTFEITVRSAVPTEDEMVKARDLALAVTDYQFF